MKRVLPLFIVRISGILFLALSPLASFVCAEEETASLEEVVVTATRIKESRKDIPASVQVITREDIKNSTANDAGDLIAEAAAGHVHKYPGASTARVALRGLTTDLSTELKSRVLVLVNGNRAGTTNLAKIPVDDIEKIEIVKGPASVLYGSSGMGGVINIITKEGKEGFHGSVGAEAGSWDYWKTYADLSGKKGPVDFALSASRSSSEDYEAKGYGTIENTAYDDETLSLRLGYELSEGHHVSVGLQHWRGWDIGSPNGRYAADPDNFNDKERDGYDIAYRLGTFNAKYYFVRDEDESHSGGTSATRYVGNNKINITERETQGASLQNTFAVGNHRLIIGGQWDRVDVDSFNNTGAPYNPNSRYDSYGAFAEGRLSLFDKKLLLSAGLRYDYFENEILATPGIKNLRTRTERLDHVTVRGGVVYKLTDAFTVKGSIGTAFRAPAPDELATDYVSQTNVHYLGNPDLKPEKSTSYDLGVEYARNHLKGGLTVFHTDFRDKILSYFDTTQGASTFKNVDGATLEGIEANLSWDIGRVADLKVSIEPFANITWHTRYESDDSLETGKYGETLLYTPRWTGAFGIRAGQDSWDARLIANHTGDEKVQDWAPPSNGKVVVKKGDFTVVSLKGSYMPVKNIEVTASVENLFDREYEYVMSFPMPRRTFTGGVKWIF